MGSSDQHPGTTLAQSLLGQSEREASMTPMDAVLDAARQERLTADQCFRLVSRLWTFKRLMYYVYGGWAQGINLNDYPPAVAYLFGKQIYDESTHEMQYLDEILRRRWVRTQRKFFEHPYGQFATASRVSAYIFCLRALANYPQNLRIAALNLGPKVIELAWTERFARSFPDDAIRALFMSQLPETRSHILMGRFSGRALCTEGSRRAAGHAPVRRNPARLPVFSRRGRAVCLGVKRGNDGRSDGVGRYRLMQTRSTLNHLKTGTVQAVRIVQAAGQRSQGQ